MIPTYNDWHALYGDDLTGILTDAFAAAAIVVDPDLPRTEAHKLAVGFAEVHAGELLKLDGDLSMASATRMRVKALVADAIDKGQGLGQLKKNLREDIVFSKDRAMLTARTETAIAHGQGSRDAAVGSGRNEKMWISQGATCEICEGNEGDDWIDIDETFSSGDDTIPAHPNCECNVRYRSR